MLLGKLPGSFEAVEAKEAVKTKTQGWENVGHVVEILSNRII